VQDPICRFEHGSRKGTERSADFEFALCAIYNLLICTLGINDYKGHVSEATQQPGDIQYTLLRAV
jgi:hypothetical protein